MLEKSPVAKYMNPKTREYYHLASNQYTILSSNIQDAIHILSKEGMFLYLKTMEKYLSGEIKGVFETIDFNHTNSGYWKNDIKSEFYDPEDNFSYLNSFQNLKITGLCKFTSTQKTELITTSVVIFLTSEFALTQTGSIYKF